MQSTLLKVFAVCAAAVCVGAVSLPGFARPMPAAAGGDAIVLMTVKPKDPSSPSALAYAHPALSQEEARRHMRAQWSGPAQQHEAESGTVLAVVGGPLMTRQRLVEATLAAYEKLGGRRADVRIDVLSAGSAAPRAATSAQSGATTAQAQEASVAPSATTQAEAASRTAPDRACVTFRPSAKTDHRGEAPYYLIRNGCGGPIILARGRNAQSCTPMGNVRPGVENEFHVGDVFAICLYASSVSFDQAITAQDLHCRCPASATSVTHPAFTKTVR